MTKPNRNLLIGVVDIEVPDGAAAFGRHWSIRTALEHRAALRDHRTSQATDTVNGRLSQTIMDEVGMIDPRSRRS
ncbi:MAG: hypothetical protein QM809_04260 [Gordonia sp. (in: high G+C Gram-positive bacteria)]|uniref:hypothetical protein n=1 Tax=Gordonia sp. (in: high G+C Gram-positive bacteria) TaxID=84139 RepID=UPI0039E5C1E7